MLLRNMMSTYTTVIHLLVSYILLGECIATQGTKTSTDFQQLVDSWIALKPAGAVAAALVSPDDTDYFFSGQLSSNNPVLPNENTVFEIGSITKAFAGILLADQVLLGNVFLNDTLAKLLTDWPGRFSAPANDVTLLELATHSSGLPGEPDNLINLDKPFENYTAKQLYHWLDKVELVNRSSYLYSNAGAGILGHALELNRRQKFEDFVKERVLIPLGLRDTTITLNDDQKRRFPLGHGLKGEIAPALEFDVLAAAGALRSTLAELVKFVRLATGITSIQKEVGDALEFATIQRKKVEDGIEDEDGIGLFWTLRMLPQDIQLVSKSGGTLGFNSFVGWVPERQVGVIVLVNCRSDGSRPSRADDLAISLLEAKFGL